MNLSIYQDQQRWKDTVLAALHRDEEADQEEDSSTTLLGTIAEAMATDDADPIRQSRRLVAQYVHATPAQQEAIDDAFICCCGWSLRTLIARTFLGMSEEDSALWTDQ